MANHTPAPWFAWDDNRTIGIVGEDGEPFAVCEIVDHGDMADERLLLADQRIVAAAPTMLRALQDCLPLFDMVTALDDHGSNALGQAENAIRAAIASATGQTNNGPDGQCQHCGRDNAGYEHERCADDCPFERTRGAVHVPAEG